MWDKLWSLNWFWQFLCDELSSFNLKEVYYSYAWSCSLCERRNSFYTGLISSRLWIFLLTFSIGFTSLTVLLSVSYCQCKTLSVLLHLVSFPSVDHLHLYAWFSILYHLKQRRFSPSTHLPMCLLLETLTSIIRTD